MPKYVATKRLSQAVCALGSFPERAHPRNVEHIIPLLSLTRKGVRTGVETPFEERDDFEFWDRYMMVDPQSPSGRYYDPLTATRYIATHPHSNVATARKGTFAGSWHAGSYRMAGGRTLWTLADDYIRKVRERALTGAEATVSRIPALDLLAWLRRFDSFPEGVTTRDLLHELVRESGLSAPDFSALFEVTPESDDAFFASAPAGSNEVLEFIRTTCDSRKAGENVSSFMLDPARLGNGLALQDGVVEQAVTALSGGSHLILAGPPGTGKSTLAEMLASEAARTHYAAGYKAATASADWTTFETVGGYAPARGSGELIFHPGIVLRTIRDDNWCILDELNRGNVDRAIGPLLTLLAGSEQTAIVELPQQHVVGEGAHQHAEPVRVRRDVSQARSGQDRDSGDYVIGRNWRLLGTLNTLDRGSLFPLTAAFARRFATVHVGVPPAEGVLDLLDVASGPTRDALRVIMTRRDGQWTNPRPLGPAIAKDVWQYVQRRRTGLDPQAGITCAAEANAVLEAISLFVLPQYGGLAAAEWGPLCRRVAEALTQYKPDKADTAGPRLDAALHDLFGVPE